ncbi:MAG: universal stress protein [Planctomycetes bacterium]|nr:universal stress protein [Planctomycetota bacterium]
MLVPLDGSRLSEAVLPPVIRLVKDAEGTVVLFHAVTPSEYFSITAAQYVQQERRRSAAYLQELAERIGGNNGLGIQERIVTGEASREIVAEAARCRADLIAMSSHGRSGIREWAFGSVAERVLRTTNLPVLVFRGNLGRSYAVRKIMIAIDGSEEALEVVPPAARLAAANGAVVVLVHAGKQFPPSLTLARKILAENKVAFETRLLRGEPGTAILKALEEEKADLLALTTTGKTKRDQIFFGSVAEEILKNCGRPLLVVHTGKTS